MRNETLSCLQTRAHSSCLTLALCLGFVLLTLAPVIGAAAPAEEKISESAMRQIQALQVEKESRSPVHLKLDSQFVFKLKQNRKQAIAAGVTELQPNLEFEPDGRVLVDIDVEVSQDLLNQIAKGGGTVLHSAPEYHSIHAQVPLEHLEKLAERKDVKFIRRASHVSSNTGSVTSQGDATHLAAFVRSNYAFTGAGIKVGVISDGINYLFQSQASGNLDSVTVLPGQAGPLGRAEGTAMMEIIHDLAPGAQLYYATAYSTEANFAQNILNLRSNGCQIIVDDVMYSTESPFQDGIIAQAVNTVTADGALYFSSAGNEGSFKYGAGTWEGDFVDSGQTLPGYTGKIHKFGSTNYNQVLSSGNWIDLFWADPLRASTNDYDLFVLNFPGTTVLYASTNPQTGAQDPFEEINGSFSNVRIVVVKKSGAARYLHLNYYRGRLALTTAGTTRGHSTATNAISVAAVSITNGYPNAFVAGASTHVEPYSSDGPRRVFFHANGTPITPGNFTSTGGALRQKPDLTAADGVSTSVIGYGPFNGTSAAAPHAGAIAALVRSGDPTLTASQIRAILTNSVLDIEAPGYDNNSGTGVLMADRAIASMPPKPIIMSGSPAILSESVPNGVIDLGETLVVNLPLRNMGFAPTTNLVATLLNTGGVTSASGPQTYGTIAAQGGTASQSFSFVVTSNCSVQLVATLQLQDGSANSGTRSFTFNLGAPRIALTGNFDSVTAPLLPAGWTMTTFGAGSAWQTTTLWPQSPSPPNSVAVIDAGHPGDSILTSPPFTIASASPQIGFTHIVNIFNAGGVLEISTNGGPFLDILAIGGTFASNGYNGVISVSDPSPLAGRQVFSGGGTGQSQTTVINLPATVAGQTVQMRLRYAVSSTSNSGAGWYVDSIVCNDGTKCSTSSPNDVSITGASSPGQVYLTGNLDFNLRVANSGPSAATEVTVTNILPAGFTFKSWTASAGVDLVSAAGNTMIFSITNLPGGEVKTITLSGTAYSQGTLSNTTYLGRSDGGSLSISNATATGTVFLPGIVINDITFYESDANTTKAVFTVSLSSPIATNVTVQFATSNQTAIAGQDYIATNGTVTFPPGVTTRTLKVTVLDDSLSESDETFTVKLFAPSNAVLARATGFATVQDDDPYPDLSFTKSNFVIDKPEIGTTNFNFNVSLSAASGRTIVATFSTINKKAFLDRDYFLLTNTVTFAAGETNKDFVVVVTNHTTVKPSQDFEVDIYGISDGAYLINGSAIGTINTAPPGRLDHFTWNFISSPKSNGLPFNATVSARDFSEGLATNFTGPASLAAYSVNAYLTNSIWGTTNSPDLNSFATYGYSFVPTTNITVTHLRAFLPGLIGTPTVKVSLWTEAGGLIATRNFATSSNIGWLESSLAAPVQLKAGLAYRLSVYGLYVGAISTSFPTDASDVTVLQGYYDPERDTFPTNPIAQVPLVDIRYSIAIQTPVPLTPISTGNFTNSTWTGNVKVQSSGTNVVLMARDTSGHWGISSSFNVNKLAMPLPLLSEVRLVAGSIQFSWNAIPGGFYQVHYKTNLNQPMWQNLSVPILATNSTMLWSALIGPDPQRFYRLQASLTAPSPTLEARVSSGAIQLGWDAVVNNSYQVQYKTTLAQTSWLNLGAPIVATNSAMSWSIPIGSDPRRFYRLLATP